MNNHYIQTLDDDDLAARCVQFLSEAGVGVDPELLRAAMPLVKERMKTLTEAVELLRFLFTDDITPNEKAAGRSWRRRPRATSRRRPTALDACRGMGCRTDRTRRWTRWPSARG